MLHVYHMLKGAAKHYYIQSPPLDNPDETYMQTHLIISTTMGACLLGK